MNNERKVTQADERAAIQRDGIAKALASTRAHRTAAQPEREAEERLAEALACIAYEDPAEPWQIAHDALKGTARPLTTPAPAERPSTRTAVMGEGAKSAPAVKWGPKFAHLADEVEAIIDADAPAHRQSAIAELCEGLEKAVTWFEEYAGAHDRKMREAVDSYEQAHRAGKAIRNAERAKELRALLSKHSPDAPGDERHD